MAFADSTFEGVYQAVSIRLGNLGSLALIEFDDEEYEVLRRLAQAIPRSYIWQPEAGQRQARLVFMAYACEYVRRTKLWNDNLFWEGFEKTLELYPGEYRNVISYELLWRS